MFRNSPEMGGGGIACLGPTTIIEMTIPMSQSSSGATLDDSWVLAGPISVSAQVRILAAAFFFNFPYSMTG